MTNYGWACLKCGRRFKSVKAAERASFDGCPQCNGVDIDLIDVDSNPGLGVPTLASIPTKSDR